MIKLKMFIEDIKEYQTCILPENAVKIEIPHCIGFVLLAVHEW